MRAVNDNAVDQAVRVVVIAGKPRSYRSTRFCRSERAAIRLARDSVRTTNTA
ncbi:hypothetical protein PCAU_2456 [Pseudomonas chlororaphis subsp. aurantiaca]|nr:hypothetical protein PCAU_2456 [Pseudomonas chlororaphis subsp. aurantiaca]